MPTEDTLNKIRAVSVRIVEEASGGETPNAAPPPPPQIPRLNAREIIDIFRNTLPAWERDGLGLRGLVTDSKLFDPDFVGAKPEPQTFSLTQQKAELDSPESVSSPPTPTFNEFRLPTGCPFDMLLEIEQPPPSSTSCILSKSARLAVFQHKECKPFPDCSGTFDLRQYASVFTQGTPKEVESGLWSFYEPDDTSKGVGLKAVTRPEKTFFSLYKNDNKQFFHSLLDQNNISVYGYADEQKYNFALAASKTQDSSFLRLFGTDAKVYASIGTEKSGPSESFVYGYAGDGDTRYKIVAKPAAASMGVWDEGSAAGDGRYVILNTGDWPTATTSSRNVRLVACSNSYKQGDPLPTLVKLREIPDGVPSGCPYDLYPALSEGSSSAWAAVRHTTCVSPGVGNFVFDQYATVRVSQTANGFFAYEGTGLDGYIAAETKGQAETFVYGYADQGSSNFRLRALGADQVVQIWSTARDTINKLENTTGQTVLYGRYSGKFQYTTKANNEKSASIFSDTNNNGYLETATKGQAETFVYGYADQGQSNFRARAFGFDSKVEVYHNNGNYYNQMYYDTGDGGFYGFWNAVSYYRLWGTQTKSELQLWRADDSGFLEAGTTGQARTYVAGFCDLGTTRFQLHGFGADSHLKLWLANDAERAELRIRPQESVVYGYLNSDDRSYRMRATPTGASMEAWHNAQNRTISLRTEDFPVGTTSAANVRLVACSETYKAGGKPTLVTLREVRDTLPQGCPYDLYPALSEGSSSAWAAVKHTGCVGPGAGNFNFDKYASVRASETATGLFAYASTQLDGYIAAETKGQAETYVYGYADQGQSNFRARAFGSEQVIQIWSTAQDTINKLENTTGQTVLYGRYSGKFQYATKADNEKSASIFSDTNNNGYLETATKGQAETFVWGYSNQGAANFRARADVFDAKVEVYRNDGNFYNQMYYEVDFNGSGGFYGFYNSKSYYRLWGTQDKAELQLWQSIGAEWLQATAKDYESVVYGFAANTNYAYRVRATDTIAQMQIWQGAEGSGQFGTWYAAENVGLSMTKGGNDNAATLEVASGEAGIGLFLKAAGNNNPFARLVVNGLTMYDGGTGSYLTRTTLGITTSSQAAAFVSSAGLYAHNGANYVDIKPPAGKDAYFQLVDVCVGGVTKKAYILMTQPFE
jgi:predicted nucleic acid-binding protein